MYNSRKGWLSNKCLDYLDWIDNKLVYIGKSEKSESGTPNPSSSLKRSEDLKKSFHDFFYFGNFIYDKILNSNFFFKLESSVISTEL